MYKYIFKDRQIEEEREINRERQIDRQREREKMRVMQETLFRNKLSSRNIVWYEHTYIIWPKMQNILWQIALY